MLAFLAKIVVCGAAAWLTRSQFSFSWYATAAVGATTFATLSLALRKKKKMFYAAPTSNETMQAFVLQKYGHDFTNTLSQATVGKPTIDNAVNPDDIIVSVLYAAADPVDYKCAHGNLQMVLKHKLPYVYGQNFCGVVKQKGASVTKFNVGDLVVGLTTFGECRGRGSFAEFVACPEHLACRVGDDVKKALESVAAPRSAHVLAPLGGLPLVACTALQALDAAGLQSHHTLLILGGSTAVGLCAIQLARIRYGCSNIIVTSSQDSLCRSLGATQVINYRSPGGSGDWRQVLGPGSLGEEKSKDETTTVHVVFDCVGDASSFDDAKRYLFGKKSRPVKKGEKSTNVKQAFVTITRPHAVKPLGVGDLVSFGLTIVQRKLGAALFGQPEYYFYLLEGIRGLDYILDQIAQGRFTLVLDPDSPLEPTLPNLHAMVQKQAKGTAHGKLVMSMAGVKV